MMSPNSRSYTYTEALQWALDLARALESLHMQVCGVERTGPGTRG